MFERWKKWRSNRPTRLNLLDTDPRLLRDLGLEHPDVPGSAMDRATALHLAMLRHK